MKRSVVAITLVVACGPAVDAGGDASGSSSSSGTTGFATSSSSTTEAEASTATVGDSSSGASPPALVEVEGLLHYDPDNYKNPIAFETCDGEWLHLDVGADPKLAVGSICGGVYLRVRGSLQPALGPWVGDELVVSEVLQWRACEPGDCGRAECEPLVCLWRCNLFDQDCGDGSKCVAFSADGGALDGTRCVPVDDEPDALGEPCTRGGLGSATDSCAAGAVCMGGAEALEGVCVAMCSGSLSDPTCDAGTCVITSEGAPYCLPTCVPEQPGCDGTCLPEPSGDATVCVPGPGLPELYAPCEPDGCEDFTCATEGPAAGLCVPPP